MTEVCKLYVYKYSVFACFLHSAPIQYILTCEMCDEEEAMTIKALIGTGDCFG